MKIPAYVIDMMSRSSYCFDWLEPRPTEYGPGYTINIRKATPYTKAETLRKEVERLAAWVSRQPGGECHILRSPAATHYCDQYATVTIWDPVMKHIEQYIPKED